MLIDADFPGGNVQIYEIKDDHVQFGPDNRDSVTGWFYWCFRVRQAQGRTLRFQPCRKNLMTSLAPAVSYDAGQSWTWLERACVQEDDSFTLTIPADANEVRLCMTIPYTHENLEAFSNRHIGRWQVGALCVTQKGTAVPIWRIGPSAERASHRAMITARHHCCESMASFVVEGIIEAALANDELGKWWQQHVNLTVIPFVDYDGVVAGDQGKNRHPRDHNRDYDGNPIYPQTPAIEQEVKRLAALGLDVTFDMHCPWIHGPYNEAIYMVGQEPADHWARQEVFARHLQAAATGPLTYDPSDNIPYGVGWNNAKNYTAGRSFSNWSSKQEGVGFSTSFEIPYSLVRGTIITADTARIFGRQIAAALRAYLKSS
jgi:hypothetical protein